MSENRKVIFLDVDGVLNRLKDRAMLDLIPELLEQLARIVEQTDAVIVLSSFWRLSNTCVERLNQTLADYGLLIHSHTPVRYHNPQRGLEIQQWMDENWVPERFVILDDNGDMCHLLRHLVRTNPGYGLTVRDADLAIRLLNSPSG